MTLPGVRKPLLDGSWWNNHIEVWDWVSMTDILAGGHCDMPLESWAQVFIWKREESYNQQTWLELVNELSTTGIKWPIMWDREAQILGNGHHRVTACHDLMFTHVPAIDWRKGAGLHGSNAAWNISSGRPAGIPKGHLF